MQRRIVHAGACEGVDVGRVVSRWSVVGHDVRGVCRNGDRLREIDLLPARAAFTSERRDGQLGASARPEMADMSTGVCGCLVEAKPEDSSIRIGAELQSNLDRTAVTAVRSSRRARGAPYAAGTGLRND